MATSDISDSRPRPLAAWRPPLSGLWEWLDDRLGVSDLNYAVPSHAQTIPYMLGGISAFGFLVLVITGIYLAQFYDPAPTSARDSVLYILSSTSWAEFFRSVHFWMANLVMITVLLHAVRVFATGAYKPPRELNWLVGLALLGTALGLVFTGTVLKWDQEGWEALQHNQDAGRLLGSLGVWFTSEFTRSVPLLTRLYVAHILILPALLGLLIALHFWLVKHHGVSSLPGRDEDAAPGRPETEAAIRREGSATFLQHLAGVAGYGFLLLVLASVVSLLIEAPLGPAIVRGPETTKPPWLFLPLYPLEDVWGVRALLFAPIVIFGLLAIVPFVDRKRARRSDRRKVVLMAGFVALVFLVAMAIYAYLAPTQQHLMEAGAWVGPS